MTEELLTSDALITRAKEAGVDFGLANPKIRLAYLAKLKLIPAALRRKIGGKLTGCYPPTVVSRLKQIEQLKAHGQSYSQIRFSLDSTTTLTKTSPSPSNHTYGVAFLIIGLILGYLVAAVRGPATTPATVLGTTTSSLVKDVSASNSTLDPTTQEVIRIVNGKKSLGDKNQIYIISLPEEKNFSSLERTNINQLISDY